MKISKYDVKYWIEDNYSEIVATILLTIIGLSPFLFLHLIYSNKVAPHIGLAIGIVYLIVVYIVLYLITEHVNSHAPNGRNSYSTWDYSTKFASICIVLAIIVATVATIVSVVGFYRYISEQIPFEAYVTDKHWSYNVNIERWTTNHDDCWGHWCEPAIAYNVSVTWEDTGRDRKVGERCTETTDSNGKKTEECEDVYEDVYDNHVRYTYNGWKHNRTLNTNNNWRVDPYYAEPDIDREYDTEECPSNLREHGKNAPLLGCERVSGRNQSYTYTFRVYSAENPFSNTCPLGSGNWFNLALEQHISGMQYLYQNNVTNCGSISLVESEGQE